MFEDQYGSYHAIPVQSGRIALRVKVEHSGQHALLPLLNVFGKLYHGTVKKEYFNRLFQEKRKQFLEQLNTPTVDSEKYCDFRLRMTRLSLDGSWKWPACVNMINHEPEWATGNGRILASGLTKKNPEQALSVLFFDQAGTDVAQWIENPVEITTDQQLHALFGLTYDTTQSDCIQLYAVIKQVNNRTCLLLHGIVDEELQGYQNSQESTQLIQLDKLRAWQKKYTRPRLKIYTDWPDLVHDSLGVWDVCEIAKLSTLKINVFLPGHLEKLARQEHQSAGNNSVLFVKNPRAFDLSELLVWMDLEHTTFIEQDWNFLLYQNNGDYKSKMIGISSI